MLISRAQTTIILRLTRSYSLHIKSLNYSSEEKNLAKVLQKLPQTAGSGPFPEKPRFEVMGNKSSIMSISLPASAEIFMRKGSIIASNGSSQTDLFMSTSTNASLAEMARVPPVVYEKITSISPTSLLVSADEQSVSNAITILDMKPENSWIISQRKCILGWTSSSVKVEGHLGYNKWGNVKAEGSGQLALVGQGELYEVQVPEGEDISLNPSTLLAYKTTGIGEFVRLPRTRLSFDIPVLSTHYGRSIASFFERPIFQKIGTAFKQLFARENIVFKVEGPTTLIVQTKASNIKSTLTDEEIKKIVEKS